MKVRNDPTAFLPLGPKISGQVVDNKPKINQYLTEEQARYVYKKTESDGIFNTDMMHHQQIEQGRQTEQMIQAERPVQRINS